MKPVCRTRPLVVHEGECELEGWMDPARGGVRWRTLFSAGRTDSEAITCGIAEVTSRGIGEFLGLHQHVQPEVYYILSGEGVVAIDGVEYAVREGVAVFIPSNAVHGAWSTGEESLRLFYVFAVGSFEEVEYIFPELLAR